MFRVKCYKVYEDDILMWWFSLKEGDCSLQYNPLQIINDLKMEKKEWYYNGIPLKLNTYGRYTADEIYRKIECRKYLTSYRTKLSSW